MRTRALPREGRAVYLNLRSLCCKSVSSAKYIRKRITSAERQRRQLFRGLDPYAIDLSALAYPYISLHGFRRLGSSLGKKRGGEDEREKEKRTI